mmetsp:Transcript_3085/g.7270  ORF Transcript_3085/g.7270 Transcript_3085/m.7270 type:complete len:89 (+) Transcript_3085:203-469(+)
MGMHRQNASVASVIWEAGRGAGFRRRGRSEHSDGGGAKRAAGPPAVHTRGQIARSLLRPLRPLLSAQADQLEWFPRSQANPGSCCQGS